MIIIVKANTLCKNKNCTKSKDGSRKLFYACIYCVKRQNWRSVACSQECGIEYFKQVEEARSQNQEIDTLPDRTDMTKAEVKEIFNKPDKELIDESKAELSGYKDDIDEVGLINVVEKVNQDLDAVENANESQKVPSRRKRKPTTEK